MKSLAEIAEQVCSATGFTMGELRSSCREMMLVAARQVFCYYAKEAGYSSTVTGKFINKDHDTVLYSVNKVKELRDSDLIIKNYIKKYESMSVLKRIIEIQPPDYIDIEKSEEYGLICPKCNGRGYVFDYGISDKKKIDCDRCHGTGRLKALITIQWEADK
jgi:hypothetical protein